MSNQRPGCLGFLLGFGSKKAGPKQEPLEVFPYAIRDDFLSAAELSFFRVFQQAIGDQYIICPKVALKDIFFVKSRDRSTQTSYSNKINLKHVDFLLCSRDEVKPVCGIELDDLSHSKTERMHRDAFVNKVFQSAGLRLLRFSTRTSYSLQEIMERLEGLSGSKISSETNITPTSIEESQQPDSTGLQPICKKCNVPMVLRTVKKGDKKGQEFYGCPNFPKCKETQQL